MRFQIQQMFKGSIYIDLHEIKMHFVHIDRFCKLLHKQKNKNCTTPQSVQLLSVTKLLIDSFCQLHDIVF